MMRKRDLYIRSTFIATTDSTIELLVVWSSFASNSTGAAAFPLTIGRIYGWLILTILSGTECTSKQCLQVLPVSPDVLQLFFDRCTDLFCSTLFALCQIQVIFSFIITVHARLVIIKPVTDIIHDGLKIFPGLVQNTDILWKRDLLWCTGCIKDQCPGIPVLPGNSFCITFLYSIPRNGFYFFYPAVLRIHCQGFSL